MTVTASGSFIALKDKYVPISLLPSSQIRRGPSPCHHPLRSHYHNGNDVDYLRRPPAPDLKNLPPREL